MKNSGSLVGILVFLSSTAFGHTFKCYPSSKRPEAFFAGGFALINISNDQLRLQHFDEYSNPATLLRDYTFSFKRIKTGSSAVANMAEYTFANENVRYGDAIYSLFISQDMMAGKTGRLVFAGRGYSWDWNFCKLQQ